MVTVLGVDGLASLVELNSPLGHLKMHRQLRSLSGYLGEEAHSLESAGSWPWLTAK